MRQNPGIAEDIHQQRVRNYSRAIQLAPCPVPPSRNPGICTVALPQPRRPLRLCQDRPVRSIQKIPVPTFMFLIHNTGHRAIRSFMRVNSSAPAVPRTKLAPQSPRAHRLNLLHDPQYRRTKYEYAITGIPQFFAGLLPAARIGKTSIRRKPCLPAPPPPAANS